MVELTSRLGKALSLAIDAHGDQGRKGSGIPYVSHPMQVAGLALEHGADEDVAVAALLHDVLEDTETSRAEIAGRFGERVARIVEGCSDATSRPRPPWRERKERHVAHLREADADVALVSCADKLHNARSILHDLRTVGDSAWDKFHAPREEQLWYYDGLVEALRGRAPEALHAELARVVRALHAEGRGA